MAIDGAKFRKPVEPGVLLRIEVRLTLDRGTICKFAGRVLSDGKVMAETAFTAMIADPPAE
jgi:3-hydroxyacyl-[acyl-carrier-protein] dehydratase